MIKFLRIIVLVVIFSLPFSCKEKLIETPNDLIPQQKMTNILYDLALIKGLDATNANVLGNNDIETMPYLYKKYDIDSLQFTISDEYYASIPEVYQLMYQQISDSIETHIKHIEDLRVRKSDSVRNTNKRRIDSLNKKNVVIKAPVPSKK